MDQPYVTPQVVVMQAPQRNGLGVFGFFVAIIGLFIPTGIVAALGLMLSLAAIGRSPRGFATAGVIFGFLGTLMWMLIMLGVVVVGVVAVAAAAAVGIAAFALTQPEVVELTSDMVNIFIAAEAYKDEHRMMPEELEELELGRASLIDPWGGPYRLMITDDRPGVDVISNGPDGAEGTDDDVHFTRLDRLWAEAFEGFEEKMERLGERLEHLESVYECPAGPSGGGHHDYEWAARRSLDAERTATATAGR